MKEKILVSGNVAYLPGAKATVFLGANRPLTGRNDGEPVKELKPEKFTDTRPWAVWGDDDLFPETVRDDVKYSIMLSRGLQSKAKMLYGSGLMTYRIERDDNGKENIVPFRDEQFETWAEETHLNHYLSRSVYQHEFYNNIFPRLIFSRDKKKVNKLICEKSRYCRWEKIGQSTGKISNCYVSAWFDQMVSPTDKDKVKTLPVINLFDDMEEVLTNDSAHEYIYRAMYPLSNEDYYAIPAWNAARESGWVEVEKRVPELKKWMFTNQINIRFHIQIPEDYYERKFGKDQWSKWDEKQQKEKILDVLSEINNFLAGSENAYKAFVSHFGVDPISKQPLPGWKIEKIDSSNEKSEFLEDVDQANLQISYALGWDLALQESNRSGMGAGSGSDKREAWLVYTSMLRLDRDFVLAPLYWIKKYNGWNPDLQFGFRDTVLTTLDKNPTGSQKVVSN